MENYICINGKKAELTEEQMKALGIELQKSNPFERINKNGSYYFISDTGRVLETNDMPHLFEIDNTRYNVANYCADREIMRQRALHETLNRLLWRYSMEHGAEEINWQDGKQQKWEVCYNHDKIKLEVFDCRTLQTFGSVYFASYQTAWDAIEEIIEPFMEAHPEFKW